MSRVIYGEGARHASGPCFRVRHLIVALLFMSTLVGFATRVVLSVTIVAMLNNTVNPEYPQFNWDDEGREGLVLSSFFWGYAFGQIPSGFFVQHCGPKWPLFTSVCVSSICVVLLPTAAIYGGWIATCIVRTLQGLSQASLYPSLLATLALWTPLEERVRLSSIAFSGSQIGTIVAFPISGFLIPSAGGWPSVYYVFGMFGLLWSASWYFLGASSPSLHTFISNWALIIVHSSHNYGFWTLISEIPTYMDSILEFNIKENGLLSALPYVVMAVLSFIFGATADFMFKRKLATVDVSRKIFNTIGIWIPAFALLGLGFVTANHQTLAVILLVIAVGFCAGCYAGFSLGHMDLSPNFAGLLMGVTNCAANVFSVIGMLIAEYVIRSNKTNVGNWQIVFSISATILFLGNLIYIIVFKAQRQPWNEPDFEDNRT